MDAQTQTLSQNPFFKGLSPEQFRLIVDLFEPYCAPAGAVVFRRGDTATHLYLVLQGAVTIQYKPYDGPMITLSHLQPGGIFGWSSVVGASSYTSDAVCTVDLDALRLRGSDLLQLCREHPEEGFAVLDRLAEAVSPRWTYARQQIQEILENHAQQ